MNKAKILVIDDELDVVKFLSTLLEDHGYATCSARDGVEAMERIQKDSPDLICLDLLMPNKTGVKFFHEIRKHPEWKKIPVIMITGWGPPEYPGIDFKRFIHERHLVPPPEGYLEKPIDQDALLQLIADILERRADPMDSAD
jgi:CheY-like chemotaxis protein